MKTTILTRQELDGNIQQEFPEEVNKVTFHDCTLCNLGEFLLRETLGKDLIVPKNTTIILRMNPKDLILREGQSIKDSIPVDTPIEKVIQIDKKQATVSLFRGGTMMKLIEGGS